MDYLSSAAQAAPEIISLRHDLHRQPEIGLQLPWTQARLLEALKDLPLEITLGESTTSITAVLRGGKTSEGATATPAVLLRGDMDALPVPEETGLPFTSEVEGAMHACGHDAHMAMLVGAARLLSENAAELPGDVVFMFQPGEEGHDGARFMLEEGVLDAAGPRVSAAYALHVFSSRIPRGTFVVRKGAIMSASDTVHIRVVGRGGHGSAPQRTADPITAAAEMVLSLQAMVTRRFDAFDPVVLSIGMIRGGAAENVIPDVVDIKATVRTFSAENRERMHTLVPQVLAGVAAAHSLEVEVDYRLMYPVTVNDAAESELVADVVTELFGADRLQQPEHPLSASEDFSRVIEEVPGVFIPFGATIANDGDAPTADNHSPQSVYSDDVLADGAALLATVAHRRLASTPTAPTTKA